MVAGSAQTQPPHSQRSLPAEEVVGAADARFRWPIALLCSADGRRVFVADCHAHCIRVIHTATGRVKCVAGDGVALNRDGACGSGGVSSIDRPRALAFDPTCAVPETVLFVTAERALAHSAEGSQPQPVTPTASSQHLNRVSSIHSKRQSRCEAQHSPHHTPHTKDLVQASRAA